MFISAMTFLTVDSRLHSADLMISWRFIELNSPRWIVFTNFLRMNSHWARDVHCLTGCYSWSLVLVERHFLNAPGWTPIGRGKFILEIYSTLITALLDATCRGSLGKKAFSLLLIPTCGCCCCYCSTHGLPCQLTIENELSHWTREVYLLAMNWMFEFQAWMNFENEPHWTREFISASKRPFG